MKKQITILSITFSLLVTGLVAHAQPKLPVAIAVRGGVMGNVNENASSYIRHGKTIGLFTFGFSIDGMYDFTNLFGTRLSVSTGKNSGAANSLQSGGGFYPYYFNSVSVFADAMIHFGTPEDAFSSRIYGGLGYAHSYNFVKATEWSHEWDDIYGNIPHVTSPNNVFGFRLGYLGEWHVTPEVGILVDACGEFMLDKFNGLQPYSDDHDRFTGYAGFPFDMRFVLSLGIAYHF